MIQRYVLRLLLIGCSGYIFVSSLFAHSSSSETAPLTEGISTNAFRPVKPGPVDGQIATMTAKLLERYHYLRPHFDGSVSSKFFDQYLQALDPQHLHFLQSDLAEFETYRTNLDRLTLPERGVGDTRPACDIFNRFVLRLQQRVAYADDLLRNEKFSFDTDERIVLNRKDSSYPMDLNEAKKLWRDRLRFEYLQEKLGKVDAKKKASAEKSNSTKTDVSSSTPPPDVGQSDNTPEAKPKKSEAQEIVDTLSHRYHRNLHAFLDWDNDDVLQWYLTSLAHVFDPHSDYFGHSQLDSFAITMNLSLFGIGAELMSEDGYCTIHRILPNGPAEKSKKVNLNDRIIAVAQSNLPPVDVVDMSLNKAVQLIRGPKGTEVRLTIIPAGDDSSARKLVTLIRDEIKLEDQEAKAKIIEVPGNHGASTRLGVIDLPSFYASFDPSNTREKSEPKSTTADVARLLTKLKQENVGGVVLDLRRNGGGSLEEAIRLTGLFIKEGPVVQVKDFDGTVQEDDDTDASVLYEGPLIVLTSRLSASASEILAGALQDYGRALIVGDSSTHGKGTVQSVQPLRIRGSSAVTNDPGALKLTIKKFYRPSGASTQLKGVVPDIVLPSLFNEAKEIGESALENPLAWDTIEKSKKLEHLNLVDPYLQELRKRSGERVAADKEFSYIREDIELYKKRQADKTFSLNEKQQLAEKEEADTRQKTRDKERLARMEPSEKTYELTLKQAMLPGLPAPVTKTNAAVAKASSKGQSIQAVSTNDTVASVKSIVPSEDLDVSPDEEKPPAVDADLLESEHILMDYISLLPKNNVASAVH